MTKARKVNRPRDWAVYVLQCLKGLMRPHNWKLLKCPPTLARASYLDISTVGFLLYKLFLAGWNAYKTVTLQFFNNIKCKKIKLVQRLSGFMQ